MTGLLVESILRHHIHERRPDKGQRGLDLVDDVGKEIHLVLKRLLILRLAVLFGHLAVMTAGTHLDDGESGSHQRQSNQDNQ